MKGRVVFFIGAGLGKNIQCSHSHDFMTPPASRDFFSFCAKRAAENGKRGKFFDSFDQQMINYINSEFGITMSELIVDGFYGRDLDLEDFFVRLDRDILTTQDSFELNLLRYKFVSLIGSVFSYISYYHIDRNKVLSRIGHLIKLTQANVITTNYDCLIEQGLEKAFGAIAKGRRYYLFDRLAQYCVNPTVGCRRGNHWAGDIKAWDLGSLKPNPDHPLVLKLHGSVNWLKFNGFKSEYLKDTDDFKFSQTRMGQKRREELYVCHPSWEYSQYPSHRLLENQKNAGWVMEPVVVSPVRTKERYICESPFPNIWLRAKELLKHCETLVMVGYGLPETDLAVRKLLKASSCNLKRLYVINPNKNDVKKTKDFFSFVRECHVFPDVNKFLDSVQSPNSHLLSMLY